LIYSTLLLKGFNMTELTSVSGRKVMTNAAKRWLDQQLSVAQGNGELSTSIKVSETGRLSAEHVADFFRAKKFDVSIGKDSDVVTVTPRKAKENENSLRRN
jgi:hypothetical protein